MILNRGRILWSIGDLKYQKNQIHCHTNHGDKNSNNRRIYCTNTNFIWRWYFDIRRYQANHLC